MTNNYASLIYHELEMQLRGYVDALPSPKLDPRWALVSKTMKLWGLEGTLPAFNTKRGRGPC